MTFGGVTRQIEDTVARASIASINEAIVSINAAIDALTGTDDTTLAIDTMNEVIAFLTGLNNEETLANRLLELQRAINAAYVKPVTNIPKSDLASDVQTSLGKADTALQQSDLTSLNAAVTALQTALNNLVNGESVTDAIDTFNEVTAFLNGLNANDNSLALRLSALQNAIAAVQSALAGKVESSSLATVATTGSYNDLSNKPTIPGNLSQLSDDATHRTVTDAEKTAWGNKQNALTFDDVPTANSNNPVKSGGVFNSLQIPVENVSSTGDVSQALNPNTFYKFGAVDSLALTLVAVTGLVVYFGRFSTSANWGGTGLTVPNGVTEGANNPTVEASKTYEFNIMDNVLLLMEV